MRRLYKHSIVETLAVYLSILQGFIVMAGYADAEDMVILELRPH